MKRYLLFDLDGTLTDSKLGITTCVQYALRAFGIEEPDLDKLEPFIGPPLSDSFQNFYRMSREQAQAAVEKYRERFRDVGIFENQVYPGIPKMLRTLKERGMHLAVASSKPEVFVERILEHFHLREYFEAVVGSELDGRRGKKEEVMEEALGRLFGQAPVEKDQVYMIGDRRFDMEGAQSMGVESVGVSYGYGSLQELKEAGADYIVRSVEELEKFLLREAPPESAKGFSQTLWPMLYPLLMFLLLRWVTVAVLSLGVQTLGGSLALADGASPGGIPGRVLELLVTRDGEGAVSGLTGNCAALAEALSFAAAGLFVWRQARPMLAWAREDSALVHLRREPKKNYFLMGGAALGCVLGLNLLLELSGAAGKKEAYPFLLPDPGSAVLPIGLLCCALAAPAAEEMLFRGILYNRLKRFMKLRQAVLLSALLCGLYQGLCRMDLAQGVGGFLLGVLAAYAYEYFGSFALPVLVHMIWGLVSCLAARAALAGSPLRSWPAALGAAALGAACLYLLARKKRVWQNCQII